MTVGEDGVLYFWISANAFCHQMVRSIVGLLVEVGRGKRHVSDVMRVLRGLDRQANAEPAPPQGLYLVSVRYPCGQELGRCLRLYIFRTFAAA